MEIAICIAALVLLCWFVGIATDVSSDFSGYYKHKDKDDD